MRSVAGIAKTTWKLRLVILAVVIVASVSTHRFWTSRIGESLVCAEDVAPSDAILVENFDPSYPVFQHAAALEEAKGFEGPLLCEELLEGVVPDGAVCA